MVSVSDLQRCAVPLDLGLLSRLL